MGPRIIPYFKMEIPFKHINCEFFLSEVIFFKMQKFFPSKNSWIVIIVDISLITWYFYIYVSENFVKNMHMFFQDYNQALLPLK